MLKQNKFISISFKKCEKKRCSRNFIKRDPLWPVQQKYLPSIKHSCKFLETLIKHQCNKHHIPAFSTQLHLLNLGFKSSKLINKKQLFCSLLTLCFITEISHTGRGFCFQLTH